MPTHPKQAKPDSDQEKDNKKKKPLVDPQRARTYAKYSGMAFQMGITILLGTLAGQKLDEYFQTDPYLTVFMALFSIFAALYVSLKDLFIQK